MMAGYFALMPESSIHNALLSRKMLIYRCHSYSCMLFLLLLSALGEIDLNHVGFIEPPFSMMVTPGTRATFRCRHETANVIGWRINGTSIGQLGNPDFIPGTIRHSDGSLVHILTVVVRPEYNDTDIVCVAAFIRQELPLEFSPPVTLTVFEGSTYTLYYRHFTLMFSWSLYSGCNETCTYEGKAVYKACWPGQKLSTMRRMVG